MDPRQQPLAYVTDGTRLYEVRCAQFMGMVRQVMLEDCKSGAIRAVPAQQIASSWLLVRAAPEAPDTIPEGLAA